MEYKKLIDDTDDIRKVSPPAGDTKPTSISGNPGYVNLPPADKVNAKPSPTKKALHATPSTGYVIPPVPVPISNENSQIVQQPIRGDYGTLDGNDTLYSGLKCLAQLDQLVVKRRVEFFTDGKTKITYMVKDCWGQDLFVANGDKNGFAKTFCGTLCSFQILFKDLSDREVICLSSPLTCRSCFVPCCPQKMDVFAPPGNKVGSVEQDWGLSAPQFSIKGQHGVVILKIRGSFSADSLHESVEFQVMTRDGKTVVGKISKQWSGLLREDYSDVDNFSISFPIDLSIRKKAVMLGACFFINFMFFESEENQEEEEN